MRKEWAVSLFVFLFADYFCGMAQEPVAANPENITNQKIESGSHLRYICLDGYYSKKHGYSDFHLTCLSDSLVEQSVLVERKKGRDPGTWSTFGDANNSDGSGQKTGPDNLIVEYVISGNKSIFHVVRGSLAESGEGTLFLSVHFDTDEDGIGYRIYDRSGKLIWNEFFGSPAEPQMTLECRSGGVFILHGSVKVNGVMVQWSVDHGKTWSDQTSHVLNSPDYLVSRIPKHALAMNKEILLEFDISIGMKIFRKRFVYNGDGKPLKDDFSPRPLGKRWLPTRDHPINPNGWQDYEEPTRKGK